MHYSLLLTNPEPAQGDVSPEMMASFQSAFDRYAKALVDAGVLVSIHILQPSSSATTVTLRGGDDQVRHGPAVDAPEQLSGIFVIDVVDDDAALTWAKECPGAQYGSVEIRPAALVFANGEWVSG
ncbi:MAG: hypothetical protein JWQ43_144 [Glaciihabitans sp.]|nr:hypothetical protein [Glaciihabitans sp.]